MPDQKKESPAESAAGIAGAAASVGSIIGSMPSFSWLDAVKGVLIILPKIWAVGESLSKLAKDAAFSSWLNDLEETTKKIETADNLRDRIDAAKKLAALTRRA